MSYASERDLIAALHDAPAMACLVITGAGTSAIASLFSVAGASRTVIDAQVPYASAALTDYVGIGAKQHVSKSEAQLMAKQAHRRAVRLIDAETRLIGLSCTAAIATDRVRRGENRAHIAWHDGIGTITYSIVMKKGARDREGEEKLCRRIILNALAEASGIESRIQLKLVEDEHVERNAD